MKINRHIHQTLQLKNRAITLLVLIVLTATAWLSQHYHIQIDLSRNGDNTLSPATVKLLAKIPDPVTIKVFISDPGLKQHIKQLLARYQRIKSSLTVEYIDPKQAVEQVRKYNIGSQGAVVVEYNDRTEKITFIDESSLTNTILQLASQQQRWLTFVSGHGERDVDGQANFDLGLFGKALEQRKIKARSLNLAQTNAIPENSSLLVLAGPSLALLQGELEMIAEYIKDGGNLLLLTDPGNHFLAAIEQQIGIQKLPGVLVDNNSDLYGIDDPRFIISSQYSQHPVTQGFKNMTVFPITAAFQPDNETEFQTQALLHTTNQSWTETGSMTGRIRFDADTEEREGPLNFAYALTRELINGKQQRIIVIGDGDFLSNAYLDNVGNLSFGLRMINWLTENDRFIDIPVKVSHGKTLQLTTTSMALIGFGFLLILPAAFLLTGLIIWHRRKSR